MIHSFCIIECETTIYPRLTHTMMFANIPHHTVLDHHVTLQIASSKILNQANILGCCPLQDHVPPLRTGTSSVAAAHRTVEEMCVLTPYQFTCADPFGEHVCGSGYYFHVRNLCPSTPACTKYYTVPIMLSTSCGTCEQSTRYNSDKIRRLRLRIER